MIHLDAVDLVFNSGLINEMTALRNITFSVVENEFLLLRGASGSGKSSIFSLVAGLVKPTRGDVIIDGHSIAKIPDSYAAVMRREKIGVIFQKFNLIHDLSVYDNVILPLIPSTQSKHEIRLATEELLTDLSLIDKSNTSVRYLSGGEQQRVAIARALVNRPKIILADEPTANLDQGLIESFLQIIRDLKTSGITVLIASHDPLFSKLDCIDRILDISGGKLQ
ncbi:MAG: ABC transporter ATP-binding protein [Candidatus Marinimicrobia bacterium]|nr:ABC transporter ATP-binding protein [Candidatus Neomarinimicrobiota bacterium]